MSCPPGLLPLICEQAPMSEFLSTVSWKLCSTLQLWWSHEGNSARVATSSMSLMASLSLWAHMLVLWDPAKNRWGCWLFSVSASCWRFTCHVNLLLTSMKTIILIKEKMLIMHHSSAFSTGKESVRKQGKCEGVVIAPEQFVCNCHIVN